jgi:hypothetical protein
VDFMPYEGAPREGGHEFERLILALAIGATLAVGAWLLGAFTPLPRSLWSDPRRPPSAAVVNTVSANGDVASPARAKPPVAAH